MFSGDAALTSVGDLSTWNTSNVTDMNYMFCGMTSLATDPGAGKWDTGNVTDASYMFDEDYAVPSLDLSNTVTSKATATVFGMLYDRADSTDDLTKYQATSYTFGPNIKTSIDLPTPANELWVGVNTGNVLPRNSTDLTAVTYSVYDGTKPDTYVLRGLGQDVTVNVANESNKMAGATVELRDSTGKVFQTAITDASGNALFKRAPDGTYQAVVTKVPDGDQLPAKPYAVTVKSSDAKLDIVSVRANYPKTGSDAKASVGLVGMVTLLIGSAGLGYKRKKQD